MRLLSILLLCLAMFSASGQQFLGERDGFLDDLQRRNFLYFWEQSDPETGLTRDRAPSPSFSSVAAIGFALTSYIVAAERGFITREDAAQRTLATLKFLWNAPQGDDPRNCSGHRGFFYHFLDMKTGLRYERVELSSIDTALLMAGVLSARNYFRAGAGVEPQIAECADRLYRRVEWNWMQVRTPLLSMGWHPESGFLQSDWQGYNEAMLLYILALGSPTHPIGPEAWDAWTSTYRWGEFHGYEHVNFSPAFGHQYSHVWIDFRGIRDAYMRGKGIDYFENSRRAIHSNRAYCIDNPGKWKGYGEDVWGLTACDGPADVEIWHGNRRVTFHSYWARGASLLEINDDGTIAPTAAGGSIPFAPEICIRALKAMYAQYGERLYGRYGFYDAFNPSFPGAEGGWVDPDYLGIDNGPIVLMIENHCSGLVWNLMRADPYLSLGLERAGFERAGFER